MTHLAQRIEENNHKLFFDNYFGNYQLFAYLTSQNIFAVGTVRTNRFVNPPLLSDKEMKKKERGCCDTAVSTGGVVITKWYDNKPVVASDFIGVGNLEKCKRWDKATKSYIDVDRPESIKIDKLGFLLSIYRSHVRSRKWTIRMITYAIYFALVNACFEYKKQS